MDDLEIVTDAQEWFSVLSARPIGETWHVVESGLVVCHSKIDR